MTCPVAVSIFTESSDRYLYLFPAVVDANHLATLIEEKLGDEFAYISEVDIETNNKKLNQKYAKALGEEIRAAFDNLEE